MTNELFIIDLETSGLSPYPFDKIYEIGMVKVDLKTFETIPYMSEVIYHEPDEAINAYPVQQNIISLEEIANGMDEEQAVFQLKKLLADRKWTAYNTEFDYNRFLKKFDFPSPSFCLMLRSAEILRLQHPYFEHEYKWPTLQQSFDWLSAKNGEIDSVQTHRALNDCLMSAEVYKQILLIEQREAYLKYYLEKKLEHKIKITYRKYNGEQSEREIKPIDYINNQLKAYCYLRHAERNFRIDRIKALGIIEIK